MRLAIRHLPPSTNAQSVDQLFDQNGLKTEGIIIERICPGKVGTSTKMEIPSVVYILVPNEQVALKVYKKLTIKDSPVHCEISAVQRVPEKYSNNTKPDALVGTWRSDVEFLKYEKSLKPRSSEVMNTENFEQVKKIEIVPLVAHIRKEMILRRNKALKGKKDARKRKQQKK